MIYYIPQLKEYVSEHKQFVIPTTKQVPVLDPETGEPTGETQTVETETTIPRRTLPLLAEDIGAVPQPTAGADQVVEQGADGWAVRDLTAQEIADRDQALADAQAAQVEHAVARVWQERYDRANHPMYGLDPSGAVIIRELSNAGNTIAQEIAAWVQALYDEATAREASIRAGEDPGEWTTPAQKPRSVNEAMAAV